MRISKKAGATVLVALAASVALASSGPKDTFDGRHTIDKTSYRALRWAMANSTVFAINTARLAAENDLVDYTLSSPAVSEGQLFIRTAAFLYAIGERR